MRKKSKNQEPKSLPYLWISRISFFSLSRISFLFLLPITPHPSRRAAAFRRTLSLLFPFLGCACPLVTPRPIHPNRYKTTTGRRRCCFRAARKTEEAERPCWGPISKLRGRSPSLLLIGNGARKLSTPPFSHLLLLLGGTPKRGRVPTHKFFEFFRLSRDIY